MDNHLLINIYKNEIFAQQFKSEKTAIHKMREEFFETADAENESCANKYSNPSTHIFKYEATVNENKWLIVRIPFGIYYVLIKLKNNTINIEHFTKIEQLKKEVLNTKKDKGTIYYTLAIN